MTINEEEKRIEVYLQPDEVSLAIGKGGYNIKLASMLVGYQIDVFREIDEADGEDIYLDEFNDEIDQWVLDIFKAVGWDTAKSVLNVSKEEILKRVDLEEETVDEVLQILAAEFEDNEE
jgi:N utilization substance protein A